jgi:hypothetical protein
MDVKVIDNFFPDSLFNKLLVEAEQYKWEFNRSDSNQDVYWTKFVYGDNLHTSKEKKIYLAEFEEPTIKETWDFFSSTFNIPLANLNSVYLNGLTYGVESHLHVDSVKSDAITVICYLCPEWNSFWSGATSFYDGEFLNDPSARVFYTQNVQKMVLPRYNRIVVFSSNIIHSVNPISKNYKGLRKTLMFKIKNTSYGDLFNGDT